MDLLALYRMLHGGGSEPTAKSRGGDVSDVRAAIARWDARHG